MCDLKVITVMLVVDQPTIFVESAPVPLVAHPKKFIEIGMLIVYSPVGAFVFWVSYTHCLPSYGDSPNGMVHQLARARVCVNRSSCQPVSDNLQKRVVSSAGGLGAWYQYPVSRKGDGKAKGLITCWIYPLSIL